MSATPDVNWEAANVAWDVVKNAFGALAVGIGLIYRHSRHQGREAQKTDRRFDTMNGRVQNHAERLDRLDRQMANVATTDDIKRLERGLDAQNGRFDRLDERIDGLYGLFRSPGYQRRQ